MLTTAALIAAGAGCAVAKHGNRSATSMSGSADLLEALGARIDLTPEGVERCIEEAGFGFMFAPAHHQATRFVVPVRRELAVKTIFNLLGPLTNPAGARRQLIGVSDPSFLETIAGALQRLGVDRALVVAGEDGLDEVSISAATRVVEVNGEELHRYTLTPGDVGDRARRRGARGRGGTPEENAADDARDPGGRAGCGRSDLALINAGTAIYAAGVAETHRGGRGSRTRGACRRERGECVGALPTGQQDLAPARGGAVSAGAPTVLLERILESTREELERRKRELPAEELEYRAFALGGEPGGGELRFGGALRGPGMAVIAEFKRRSPSAGVLREDPDVSEIVRAYQQRRRRGRCRFSPRARISTARSRICGPLAWHAICRSCARISSSIPTSCTRRGPRAPPPYC